MTPKPEFMTLSSRLSSTRKIGLLVALALASFPALGLQTQYIHFDTPDKWTCEQAQGTYICQAAPQAPEHKESLIMSIATFASEWDSLENYSNYLNTVKKIKDDAGNEITAQIRYTHKRKINGIEWIDSLQLNSELPGFWVRYLATVQNRLAILITYMVSEEYYQQLAPQFERMIATLKPNKEFDPNSIRKGNDGPVGSIIGKVVQERLGKGVLPGTSSSTSKTGPVAPVGRSSDSSWLVLLALAIAVGVGFLLLRSKKPKKKSTDISNP